MVIPYTLPREEQNSQPLKLDLVIPKCTVDIKKASQEFLKGSIAQDYSVVTINDSNRADAEKVIKDRGLVTFQIDIL